MYQKWIFRTETIVSLENGSKGANFYNAVDRPIVQWDAYVNSILHCVIEILPWKQKPVLKRFLRCRKLYWVDFLIKRIHAAIWFYFSLHVTDGQSKPMFGPWSDENQLFFKGFQGLKASCITIITIMHYYYLQNCFVRSYSWKHIRRKRNEGGCFTFGHINHNQAQLDVFLRTFCHFRTSCVHLSNCCHCRSDWMRVHNQVKSQHQKHGSYV